MCQSYNAALTWIQARGGRGAGSLSLFRGGSRVLAVTNQVHKVTQRYTPGTQRHAQVHKGTLQIGSQGNKNFGKLQFKPDILYYTVIYKGAVWMPAQNVCKMGEKYAQRVQNVNKIGAK